MDHSNHVCVLPTSSLSSNREYHEKTMKYLSSFSFSHCSAELPPPRGVMCPLRLRFSYSVSAWVENFSCMQLKARFLTRKIITLSSALSSLYMQKQAMLTLIGLGTVFCNYFKRATWLRARRYQRGQKSI
ncbi:uncharacterized protein LOC133292501 isoform X4 [Gastrolobium bilobum]|uniref:uncharacterized protein LOC133292501 isoform X4 n=1 Tax=Gastrolobium bilobum TaxID=150636 RepID=UPI002AB2148E|nr:uncharacterized protein LOC133292501 isoform X4 [Gastrolobium bilobum]